MHFRLANDFGKQALLKVGQTAGLSLRGDDSEYAHMEIKRDISSLRERVSRDQFPVSHLFSKFSQLAIFVLYSRTHCPYPHPSEVESTQ